MSKTTHAQPKLNRRKILRAGLTGLGMGAGMTAIGGNVLVPSVFGQAAQAVAAEAAARGKILVILELSGGNDGLNTVIPYADDAYYRHRPNIAIAENRVRKIDDHFGFNPGMAGFERLYKDGKLAIVHGCGYENPSYSHFTSMAYWHTAAPNSGEDYGWVGRLADQMAPDAPANYIVNIANNQSLAVRSERHVPIVFDSPNRFQREAFAEEHEALNRTPDIGEVENPSRRFLLGIARSATESSALVRQAWANYNSPVDYGINSLDLPQVVSLIDAGMPTPLYYVSYRNNAFDTHVFQNALHQRLLTYTADAVSAFQQDIERIGRADDVVMMIFSEFGRRVPENVSLGTDHGAANVMFVVGSQVKGGHYGRVPSLTELNAEDNLAYTTDFRKVYQTVAQSWLGYQSPQRLFGSDFGTFDLFG